MPIVQLTQRMIDADLACPPDKTRIEYCDKELPGLYVEVRPLESSIPTYYLRYKNTSNKTAHSKLGKASDISLIEARKKAKSLKAEITLGADPRGDARAKKAVPTLTTFFEESYLPYVKPRKRSWKKDESLFRLRVESAFGHKRLNELSRQAIQSFHAELLTHNLSEATADHYVKLIRQMLNKAVEWDVIEVNPIARIKLFNPDNRLENYLDATQVEKLVKLLRADTNRTVCNVALFLLSTGARLNEALAATWEHIDRDNRVWRIPASTNKSKRVRSVPLNDSALEVLGSLGTEDSHQHLFVSAKTGERLGNIHKVWDRLRNEAGLPRLRLHDLRHQYASFLVNSGRSLYEVQKILGHSSHSVTERYAHLSTQSLMDAANSASVLINGSAVLGPPTRDAEIGEGARHEA